MHKLVLSQKVGKIYNETNIVRHSCCNKKCINPDHLIEGSSKDNGLDSRKYSKNTKLTECKVKKIKMDMLEQNFSVRGRKTEFDKKWAKKFNVSASCITNIRLKIRWKDI